MAEPLERILVIKLGALGDFVQALGPFAAIRRHHAGAAVVLLTTAPYADLARATGFFDEVWIDTRPRGPDLPGWLALRRRLRGGGFGRIYDLQTSGRSSFYRRLLWPGPQPEWSGIAKGCSHPHDNPRRDFMHTVERQREQLERAGVGPVPDPGPLPRLEGSIEHLGLDGDFALLVPGGAPHRPGKRWPEDRYAALARDIAADGSTPVLLGGAEETRAIAAACGEARDLGGRTSLTEVAALARRARFAVGNDTGPMHLLAAMGCPSLVLYGRDSDPALCGQRGPRVSYLRQDRLEDLDPAAVRSALAALIEGP